jgi:ferredoxin
MADPLDRLPENVSGRFFVDSTCTDCDMCRTIAPQFFTRSEESAMSYVHTQPASAEELALAQEAVDSCPTDSIGPE